MHMHGVVVQIKITELVFAGHVFLLNMEKDLFFISLLCAGQHSGCSKDEVAEVFVIFKRNGIHVRFIAHAHCVCV